MTPVSRTGSTLKFSARKIAAAQLLIGALLFGTAVEAKDRLPARGEQALTLDHASGERTYVAVVPPQAPAQAAPLVIALHGFGGSGENILTQGRWRETAARHGFIVLAPDGAVEKSGRRPRFRTNPRSWNAGPATGSPASARNVDDSGFLRALIELWVAAGRVDPDRVYVTGFSNGAAMSFRAGADLSDVVAAIAPVSNGLLTNVDRLAAPVSLLMMWGEADPLNPIAGGRVVRATAEVDRPSADASFARWSALLGCRGGPDLTTPRPGVLLTRHRTCDGGAETRLYRVAGLGHQWPGGRVSLRLVSGPGSDAIDASETIWTFFAKHRRVRTWPVPR